MTLIKELSIRFVEASHDQNNCTRSTAVPIITKLIFMNQTWARLFRTTQLIFMRYDFSILLIL